MMLINIVKRLLALGLCALAGAAWAGDARIPVPGGATLILTLPDGWRAQTASRRVLTLDITPASGNAFQILVSPLVEQDGRQAAATPEALQRYVTAAAREMAPQAVEQQLPIQRFSGVKVLGLYFSATDRAPKRGEFTYMTMGAMAVDGLPVSFTILSNGSASATREPALRMLTAARKN